MNTNEHISSIQWITKNVNLNSKQHIMIGDAICHFHDIGVENEKLKMTPENKLRKTKWVLWVCIVANLVSVILNLTK